MLLSLALVAAAAVVQSDEAASPAAPLPELLGHAELESRLAALAAAHPDLAATVHVGRSRGGGLVSGTDVLGRRHACHRGTNAW